MAISGCQVGYMPQLNYNGHMIKLSNSSKETSDFGLILAKKSQGGEIYSLVGDLGSGKTCFAKGFARGLGIDRTVQSPSFILLKVYDVKNNKKMKYFCHVDVYRLNSSKEILEVGLKEYLGKENTITLIEWADKIKDVLQRHATININFEWLDKNKRKIIIKNPR